jgi:hypothetical protein
MSTYLYDIGSNTLFNKINDTENQEKQLSKHISRLIELKIEVAKLENIIEKHKKALEAQKGLSNKTLEEENKTLKKV